MSEVSKFLIAGKAALSSDDQQGGRKELLHAISKNSLHLSSSELT
jgi:hypothetical protein